MVPFFVQLKKPELEIHGEIRLNKNKTKIKQKSKKKYYKKSTQVQCPRKATKPHPFIPLSVLA